jgi:hypothetical protein
MAGVLHFCNKNGTTRSQKMAGAFISLTKWRKFYISATKMAPRVPKKMVGVSNFVQQIEGSFAVL